MNFLPDDQIVASNKKRVRRNALKPNSVESEALREFSLLHTLDSKMALDTKGEEEQKGESPSDVDDRDTALNSREKRQKVSDSAQQIGQPEPETEETMSVGDRAIDRAVGDETEDTETPRSTGVIDAPIEGDDGDENSIADSKPAGASDAERENV